MSEERPRRGSDRPSTTCVRPRMRQRGVRRLVGALLCLSIIPCGARADKSFRHPSVEIVYRLLPDGSADVEEVRAFEFDGSFSWAEIYKETRGDYGTYRIEYLGVWDADSGRELPTEVRPGPGVERIKWFYSAENVTMRFLIRYRINGAVQRYGDVAQFYWKALADRHEPVGRIDVTLVPPAPSPELFKVFVHSRAAPGRIEFAEDLGKAWIHQSRIPRNAFVEIRALLDPALFTDAAEQVGEDYESLLEDERLIARSELDRRRRIIAGFAGAAVLLAAFVSAYLYLYVKYGREPSIDYAIKYEREPPRDLPPAVLPAILSQSRADISGMPRAFAATLLELARLGCLEIGEIEKKGFFSSGRDLVYSLTGKGRTALESGTMLGADRGRDLIPFERDVLRVAITEAGDGSEVTGDRITAWARKRSHGKSNFLGFIGDRSKELRRWFERNYFELDDPRSERARRGFVGISVLAAILLVAAFVWFRSPFFIIGGFAVIILGIFLSQALARRTAQAALEHGRWTAFKRFMSDFSAMKEAGAGLLPLWEKYLVYAAALGVADKLLKNIRLVAETYHSTVPAAAWHRATGSHDGAQPAYGLASFESLSASLANIDNLSQALSSSSGRGGGFSGGGGGGGGGGGCGAG